MDGIPFTKMTGLGNDFIIIDNRSGVLDGHDIHRLARRLCARRLSVGADERMLIEASDVKGEFSLRTFDPDGEEVAMCGNAARCIAPYAYAKNLVGSPLTIDTHGGPAPAWTDDKTARIQLQLTATPQLNHQVKIAGKTVVLHLLHISGAPQTVVFVDDLSALTDEELIQRGVEGETLVCGAGAAMSASSLRASCTQKPGPGNGIFPKRRD